VSDAYANAEDSSADGTSRKPSNSALQAAADYVAASPGSGVPGDGSSEAFTASFSALVDWGLAEQVIRPIKDFPILSRAPDGHGDEHEAWFAEFAGRWIKATYPNHFGLGWGRRGSATAHEYLVRLLLQNYFFGDDIQLESLVRDRERLRVLTSQPNVVGSPAPYGEIMEWFADLGFERVDINGRIAWYFPADNLLVADAHEGNVLRTSDGVLTPIDLNLVQPTGALLQAVLDRIN
jgi:hypothetical protein